MNLLVCRAPATSTYKSALSVMILSTWQCKSCFEEEVQKLLAGNRYMQILKTFGLENERKCSQFFKNDSFYLFM